MKKYIAMLSLVLALSAMLCACSSQDPSSKESSSSGSSSAASTPSSSSQAQHSDTTATSTDKTIVVDMIGTKSSLGSVEGYGVKSFTQTYHFENDTLSSITEEISFETELDDSDFEVLGVAMESMGAVEQQGNGVVITLSSNGMYDGMSKAEVKSALEKSGYTIL